MKSFSEYLLNNHLTSSGGLTSTSLNMRLKEKQTLKACFDITTKIQKQKETKREGERERMKRDYLFGIGVERMKMGLTGNKLLLFNIPRNGFSPK